MPAKGKADHAHIDIRTGVAVLATQPILLLMNTGGMIAFFMLLYAAIWPAGLTTDDTRAGEQLHCTMYVVLLLFCIASLSQKQFSLTVSYTLPLSVRRLVAWSMLHSMFAAALMYLATAFVLNAVFNASWPWLGPLLFAAVVAAWCQAIVWSLRGSPSLFLAASVACSILLGWWVSLRYGVDPFRRPFQATRTWSTTTTAELLGVIAMIAAAYGVAVVGVTRDRCREGPSLRALHHRLARFLDRPRRQTARWSSPQEAVFWFEWRQKGMALPAAYGLGALAVVAWCCAPWMDAETALVIWVALSWLSLLGCFFIGTYIGHSSPDLRLDSFRATRPVNDTAIANAVLKNAAVGTLAAWTIWLVALALIIGRSAVIGQLLPDFWEFVDPWYIVVISLFFLMAMWSVVALGASLAMSRFWLLVLVTNLAFWTAIGEAVVVCFVVHDHVRWFMFNGIWVVYGLCFLVGTVLGFIAALRCRLIDRRTLGLAVAGWPISTALAFGAFWPMAPLTATAWLLLLAVSILPFAPITFAPLALAWNRHR